jgi:hypothetical protein
MTYVHSLIDPAAIRRFWDLGMPSFSGQDATPPA